MNRTLIIFRTLVFFGLWTGTSACDISKVTADDSANSAKTEQAITVNENVDNEVTVQKLESVPWSEEIEITGKTLARQQSTLSLGVSGMVKEILVKRGDRVKKGDVLLKLDRLGYQLGVEQAQAALAGAVAQQELMQTETARLNQLLAEGAAPIASKDELNAQRRGVDASVDGAQTALKRAKKALKDAVLKAPYDGVISNLLIELGEQAHAMPPTNLMTIVDSDTLEVQVYVPEEASSQVREGDIAKVTIDAAGVTAEGKIVFVSDVITQGARNFEVRIQLDNSAHLIKVGAFARVQLSHKLETETLFASLDTIQRDKNNKPFVYIADNGVARQRFVRLGVVNGVRVQITDGVNPGDLLIMSGPGSLQDGQRIVVKKD